MTDKLSPPVALIFAMTTLSAADRTINTDELARIGSIVRELPPFRDYTDDWLADAAQECGKILKKPNGVDSVLTLVKKSLPPRLYETAYVLCAEVAASDLSVHTEEEKFLELLASALELDELTCAALRRAARARHQRV
ncbi:tellurite resistance TerB family protein [Hyphomicrobium sp. LHD-15]|uniref:tellurite resistance TerB family protein n=1 Tax=Hyphomicrobium sp. LHD-15 TaxID=3072142 RepID=UPI00280CB5E5|nr:tellurite resistance TerB family protein [Hyphomicrobium sp. LHD-15]MDQ8698967.1 tellurite resistance TerB family protein [Hyphomicrobium sp. LHD-15]